MDRLFVEGIQDRLDTLKHELEALPKVSSVAYSSQVPFEQNNSQRSVSLQPGDEAGQVNLHTMDMSPDFFGTYDIPLLAGRGLDKNIGQDLLTEEAEVVNVVINELAVNNLQFGTANDALNQRFYRLDEDGNSTEYIVVGVVPTQNIVGLFNELKPWMFTYDPESLRIGSIRITGGNIMDTVEQIEDAWQRVIPEYPIQGQFLDATAMALASVGLFGLAAFMAAQRIKEIGMRKVLGASTAQIARLLVWQFSTPVLWALAVALPAAYFGSSQFLNFFAERIESPVLILIIAGALAVTLAWSTVAGHAIRIARSNPIVALRYE
jgi:putative ABC transport system permease protein